MPTFVRLPSGSLGIFTTVSDIILHWLLELLMELDEVLVELLGGGDDVLLDEGDEVELELTGMLELELTGPLVLDEREEEELWLELDDDRLLDELEELSAITLTRRVTSAHWPWASVTRTVMLPLPTPMLSTLNQSTLLLARIWSRKLAQPDTTAAV